MRLRALFAFCLGLVCVGTISAQDKPQDGFLKPGKFSYQPKPVAVNYLQFLPKGYDAKSEKKWPMIFFLHGAGERGSNVWKVSFHGPSVYIAQHPEFPFIVVMPQCGENTTWSDEALIALLDETEAKLNVDTNRVYLTGLSMGGYGSWSLGVRYPERFAAMAPICGGGQSIYIVLAAKGYAPDKWAYLKEMPIWVFHGAKDTVVPISESQHMIDALKTAGVDMSKVKFTVYPEAGHNAWTETYNNPELYKWFLEHERKAQPKK